jgi:hypothetical protein
MGMAVGVVFVEVLVTAGIIFELRRHHLDPWSVQPDKERIAA